MNENIKTVLRKTPILNKVMLRIDELRSVIEDLKIELQNQNNINISFNQEKSKLEHRVNDLQNKNNRLNADIRKFEDDHKALTHENINLKTDNNNINIENSDLRNESKNLANRINELKSQLTTSISSKETTEHDDQFLAEDVSTPKLVSHSKWQEYLYNIGNEKGKRILEIGSREVTGQSSAREKFAEAEYIGFDIYPGDNVDIVGDAHKLSSYFKENEKFDLIYTSACFEHFAMPWIVAEEISKMLKVGGIVFVETHFSYSSHERPWHFFQFSDEALKVLFSKALGFECIEAGMSNPMVGRFSSLADDYLKNKPITGLYCHSEYLGKKVNDVEDFNWKTTELKKLLGDTRYPDPH